MQAVAYFNKDNADVIAHGEQQFLEVFRLSRCLITEDTTANFGQPVDDLCNLGAEYVLNVLNGIVGIFHHIVQKCRADAG